MSYILDALRKADAERERDPARGIHAQPTAGAPVPVRTRAPRWAWGGVGFAAVAVGAFFAFDARLAPPAPAVAAQATPIAPPASIAIVPAPAPAVVPVAASVSPAPAPAVATVAPAAIPRPAAKPVAAAATVTAPPISPTAAVRTTAVPPAPPVSVEAVPAQVPPAPAAAGDRVLAFSELPADVQRDLPKLAISGGVHSENAAQRMLIVGGQVMAEGAELAPGVTLEQIRARSAVLRFRGLRYSVAY